MVEKELLLVRRVTWRLLELTGDEYGHHQAVNGDDARHDNRNDGLHDQLGPHDGHGGDSDAGFGCAVRRSEC